MNQQLIDYVVNQKKKSKEYLIGEQEAYIPIVTDDQIECMLMNNHPLVELKDGNGKSYTVSGMRSPINQTTQACFKLKYLKHKPMSPHKAMQYLSGIWTISTLVNNSVIYPFMVFINGIFIPWELIKIIINDENYYILVDTTENTNFSNIITDVKYVQTVALPEFFSYKVNSSYNKDKTVFMFNKDGMLINKGSLNELKYSFELDGDHTVIFIHKHSYTSINAEKIFETNKNGDVTNIKLSPNSVILFSEGKLATGNKINITKAYDIERKLENGDTVQCKDFVKSEDLLGTNPKITIDSTLLSIDSENNDDMYDYDYIIFANYNYTPTLDNISRLDLNGLQEILKKYDSLSEEEQKSFDEWYENLKIEYDPEHHASLFNNIASDKYIAKLIWWISRYNGWIFNEYYKGKSNISIEEHSGKYVLDSTMDDGCMYISTHNDNTGDEYIIILVNGELYKYYHACRYDAGKFIIPVNDILDDDIIEILRFKNVNNAEYDISFNKYENENYSPDIVNDNMILFSTETFDDHFEFPYNGLQHFPVDYTYNTDGNVILQDENYYGKQLMLVYKNRFKHATYKLERSPGDYTVDLGDKFMYCNDYKKYLIFYNGRRLTTANYRLTLPVRSTTPFSRFELYLTMPINEGDQLDVFYLPALMNDVALISEIDLSGDIAIDKLKLPYELTSELYSVWVNGKKIPASHILDIGATESDNTTKSLFRIITNEHSTQSVCVTQHIPSDEDLFKYFDSDERETIWDNITKNSIFDIESLLGDYVEALTNNEVYTYKGAVDIKSIMYELIREQYMMNPRVDTSEPFVYDYQDVDQTAIEGYDDNNNAIIPTSDANIDDNLDNVLRVDV